MALHRIAKMAGIHRLFSPHRLAGATASALLLLVAVNARNIPPSDTDTATPPPAVVTTLLSTPVTATNEATLPQRPTAGFQTLLTDAIARSDPQRAAMIAHAWSDAVPEQSAAIYRKTATALIAAGDAEAAALLVEESALAPSSRDALLRETLNSWVEVNPDAAAAWALAQPGDRGDIAVTAVVDSWINNAPLFATEFVIGLPESPQRSALVREAVSRWLAMDTVGATSWLSATGARPEFDRPLFEYVTADATLHHSRDAAAYWSTQITDESLRNEALRRMQKASRDQHRLH